MKKLTLSIIAIATLTSLSTSDYFFNKDFMSEGYNSIGIERVDFKTSNDGSLGTLNMFSYKRAYELTKNIHLAGSISLPLDNKVVGTYQQTYYDSVLINDTEETITYSSAAPVVEQFENQIKPSVMADISLRLNLPIHERLTAFVGVGLSFARITQEGSYVVDNATGQSFERILDFQPLQQVSFQEYVDNNYTRCQLSGRLDDCGYSIQNNDRKFSNFGASYSAGVNLNLNDRNAFVLEYRKYNHDGVLNPEGIYAGYQWKF